jgi:hypothetical protein
LTAGNPRASGGPTDKMDAIGRRSVAACPHCGGPTWEVAKDDMLALSCGPCLRGRVEEGPAHSVAPLQKRLGLGGSIVLLWRRQSSGQDPPRFSLASGIPARHNDRYRKHSWVVHVRYLPDKTNDPSADGVLNLSRSLQVSIGEPNVMLLPVLRHYSRDREWRRPYW